MCMYDIYGPKSSFGFFHDILRITQKELFASSLSFFLSLSLSLSIYIYCQSLGHVQLFATPRTVAPPDSSVHVILQARIPEWAALPFSNVDIKPMLSPSV